MSYSLNTFKGVMARSLYETIIGRIKGILGV